MRPLDDLARLVHRVVVDPAWVRGEVVVPQAFIPRPKDHGTLSASDKGCSAEEAYLDWMTRFPRSRADRCLTLTVGDLHAAGLQVVDDSPEGSLHVRIELSVCERWEIAAARLARVCRVWSPKP
jgi:hypothetical protein